MRISDWSSDVCSSDLLEKARISEASGPGLAVERLDGFGVGDPGVVARGARRQRLLRHERQQFGPARLVDAVTLGGRDREMAVHVAQCLDEAGGGCLLALSVLRYSHGARAETGRRSCRERVGQYVELLVVSGT